MIAQALPPFICYQTHLQLQATLFFTMFLLIYRYMFLVALWLPIKQQLLGATSPTTKSGQAICLPSPRRTRRWALSVSAKRQLAPTIPPPSRLSPTPTIGSNNGTTAIPTIRVPLRSMTTFLSWRNLNRLRPLSIVFPNHSRTNSLKSSFVRVVCTSNEVSPSIPLPVFNSVRA